MRKLNILLAALIIALVPLAAISTSYAYFTTYTGAEGGYTLRLSEETNTEETNTGEKEKPVEEEKPEDGGDEDTPEEIKEKFSAWTKHVTITNSQIVPVYFRVKAYAPAPITPVYSDPNGAAGDWNPVPGAGGYVYSKGPVAPGADTSTLDIEITGFPAAPTDGETFDVVVVYEFTPVQYTPAGAPYADWTLALV